MTNINRKTTQGESMVVSELMQSIHAVARGNLGYMEMSEKLEVLGALAQEVLEMLEKGQLEDDEPLCLAVCRMIGDCAGRVEVEL